MNPKHIREISTYAPRREGEEGEEQLSRKEKLKRHCQRRWWVHALSVIIGSAIFLPLTFLVITPAIVQGVVNETELPIKSVMITDPNPDSMKLSMEAGFKVPGGLGVTLTPTTMYMFFPDTANFPKTKPTGYMNFTMPEHHLKGNAQLKVDGAMAQVLSQDGMARFVSTMQNNAKFNMSTYGYAELALGSIKMKVVMNKTVELTGLDRLKDYKIQSVKLLLPPGPDGSNLEAAVQVTNPSVFSFSMGDLTMDMKLGDQVAGSGVIPNVFLKPGPNMMVLRGKLDINATLANLNTITNQELDALKRGNLAFASQGKFSMVGGKHIPYYEKSLPDLSFASEMPVQQLVMNSLAMLPPTMSAVLEEFDITPVVKEVAANPALNNITMMVQQFARGGNPIQAEWEQKLQDIQNQVQQFIKSNPVLSNFTSFLSQHNMSLPTLPLPGWPGQPQPQPEKGKFLGIF